MKEVIHKQTINHGNAEIRIELRNVTVCTVRGLDHGLTVNLEPVTRGVELSISAGIWNGRRDDYTECGQIIETIRRKCPHLSKLCDVWERWHLNGMKSGTAAQDAALDAYRADHPDWRYDYTKACEVLKAAGLYVDRGYTYGSAWLFEELPADVVDFVKSL